MRSLGIDVSAGRGLDLVVLDGSPRPRLVLRRVRTGEVSGLIRKARPDLVCIDSPPAWGRAGGSRKAERELARLGIHSYGTPSDPATTEGKFYEWMKEGMRAFQEAVKAGFARYRGGPVRGTALEVFPHATAVVLAGCLPPPDVPKKTWRAEVLRAQGIETAPLVSLDLIDAALAALTGIYALRGCCTALGDPDEGVIVLPVAAPPAAPYPRRPAGRRRPPQLRLPGLSPCACSDPACQAMTSGEFAPGHDARLKSRLWKQVRDGEDARAELRRRGWRLPPGTR